MIDKITVERHRWDRGQGRHRSIADENGVEIKGSRYSDPRCTVQDPKYTCCIFGFAINSGKYTSFRDFALDNHVLVVGKAVEINDRPGLTDEEREEQLTKEFARLGGKVEFVD